MNGDGGAPGRPCVVGLTGGLASGKSSVARMFAGLGAAVLDADAVVHELYRSGEPGAEAVRKLFGPAVLDATDGVDRGALAARIQEEAGALARLNVAIHPLVRERVRRWIDELSRRSEPPRVAVVEATLMVESGSHRGYDLLAVVWCRPEQQLERAVGRGMPEARARALLSGQMSLDEKRRLADLVIDNSGAPEELPARVDHAWRRILEMCGTKAPAKWRD
ncbi:MAG: dephospho-CoA kinase [Acidobacteria bacterium]|nr:dephospho-CoA kinase [Acidobacteriota bacterium]